MRTLYEPANAIEAHLLQDALTQEGFAPRVDGGYLQGALGELPAGGLIRLVIPDEEYSDARAFVMEWEKQQRSSGGAEGVSDEDDAESVGDAQGASTHSPPTGINKPGRKQWALPLLIGLALGVGASVFYFRAPVSSETVDHNDDGVPDETWTYSPSGVVQSGSMDRNLDGKIDAIAKYGRKGELTDISSDDDFDGFFETMALYSNGSAVVDRIDSNADGVADVVWSFRHDVPVKSEIINPATNLPLRVSYWNLGVLQRADIDSDKNGVLDTRITYSPLAEELKREPIP